MSEGAPLAATELGFNSASDEHPKRLDRWEFAWSDRINPIVIKELRQSLKSRQFFYTYTAMLLAVWGWSIIGLAMLLPGANYFPAGKPMLFGYWLILVIPSLLIIPLGVHRSLAGETDEDTYELLSITTLGAKQIIVGKLAGGLIQFLLLAAILAPCCAFAYLLRGIEFRLVVAMFGSVALLTIFAISTGLFLAALVRARMGQLLVLLAQCGVSLMLVFALVPNMVNWLTGQGLLPFYTSIPIIVLVTGGILTVSRLLLQIASARLTPISENRSTEVRVVLLQVQAILIAVFVLMGQEFLELRIWEVGIDQLTALWGIAGAVMMGESPELSPRVRRALPISFLGRAVLGWFHPGPMAGLMFAVAGLISSLLVMVGSSLAYLSTLEQERLIAQAMLNFGYVAAAWAIVCPLVWLLRSQVREGWVLSMAMMVIVGFSVSLVPYTIANLLSDGRQIAYSPYQVVNPAFTFEEFQRGSLAAWVPPLVCGMGLAALLLMLPFTGQNLHLPTLATPEHLLREYEHVVEPEEPIDPLA